MTASAGTPIAKPADTVFDTAPDDLRPTLESMAEAMRGDANWKVRKKSLLDALSMIETMTQLSPGQQEAFETLMAGIENGSVGEEEARTAMDAIEAAMDAGDGVEEGEEVSMAAAMLPMIVGAVLERLDETHITCVEQAAVYLLSVHPEHGMAADDWLQADPKNAKAFKKLVRADRRYAELFELIFAEDEDEEDGEGGPEAAERD